MLSKPTTNSLQYGRDIARRISKTAPHWWGRRLRASKAELSMPSELYEQAIRSARANGFVHNEALAYEVAARFYAARGFETFADAYLRNARNCYDRWGAHGKVKQLDERHPRLREGRTPAPSSTIDPPVGQLDVETVVKASQAISSEMVLPRLIENLLRIAVENAGAERGLLILLRGGEPRIEAEATTGPAGIEVAVRQTIVAPSDLPQSALHYVIRTQEGVLLDDASTDNVYSKDEYVRQKRSRSDPLPANRQAGEAGRRTLSGEQPDSGRLHAGPGYRAAVAGFASRNFARERHPLFRSATPG